MSGPIPFRWDGEAMIPLHPRAADREYVIGERYSLAIHEERSDATHRHAFAWLREAWLNLPEDLADQFPSADHLRKRTLIKAGFYDEKIVDAGSYAAALRVAAFMQGDDTFAHVVVRGALVVKRTAKSQSLRAMDKAEFQASKTALIELVSAMLGVEPTQLTSARAA